MTTSVPRIALCLFGITRSLRFTHLSIQDKIIAPLRAAGALQIYGHFYWQSQIENPRSGEFGQLDPKEHRLLDFSEVRFDEPGISEVSELYDNVAAFGAGWKGDFASLRNLCQQLVSLEKVSAMAAPGTPELYVYCRPDLMYHDCLGDVIDRALNGPDETVYLPEWQADLPARVLNDRFAIIKGAHAARAYGTRRARALDYCKTYNRPLPAETLLGHALAGIRVETFAHRATRVRFDGSYRRETFDVPEIARLRKKIRETVGHGGLRDGLIEILLLYQAARYGRRYNDLGYDQLNGPARRQKTPRRAVSL